MKEKAGRCERCGWDGIVAAVQQRERGFRNRSMTFTRKQSWWCGPCRVEMRSRWRYAK